jgi:hypothetical protein
MLLILKFKICFVAFLNIVMLKYLILVFGNVLYGNNLVTIKVSLEVREMAGG